ncbi:MAG TPA: alpha-amylase family glycosyl hydrolase [Rectinemataceae bacterium]|nr:alpha-amylase family glycosyl hydrolase [Rectinemataceae bacterium]
MQRLYPAEAEQTLAEVRAVVARRFPDLKPRTGARTEPSPADPPDPAAMSAFAGQTKSARFSAADALLIAYPDMIQKPGLPSLAALGDFAERRLSGLISHIHLLPFFPSSSDEGFSVMDFESVDGAYGDWGDVERIAGRFGLAFDLVLNHASVQSAWFTSFLEGRPPFDAFFVTRPADYDSRAVFRPRTHPLLTRFVRADGGAVHVWTTFSADQADLNYASPRLLVRMVDIFLSYVARGAAIIRLDAIAYIWKQDGTSCVDLPEVHELVRLLRALVDLVSPGTSLLSETNLPHAANVSYFGKGDEAQLVYNFPLPPLILHACIAQRSDFLSAWAASLPEPGADRAFVNFLASHDGIGVTPARGLLPAAELDRLVGTVRSRGGLVSSRSSPEGPVPYELNSTFLDAVCDPAAPDALRAATILAAHAALLSLAGLPALYFHSLVGSENWKKGPAASGSARSINRQRLDMGELELGLDDSASLRGRIFSGLSRLLHERALRRGFEPSAAQRVLSPDGGGGFFDDSKDGLPGSIFGLLRGGGAAATLALVNLSSEPSTCALPEGFHADRRTVFTNDGLGDDAAKGAASGAAGGTDAGAVFRASADRVDLPGWGWAWIDGQFEGG